MATPRASIGENLARWRRIRGLTQEALAERAGLSVDLVKKLEQRRRDSATLASLEALATALGIAVSELTEAGGTAGLPEMGGRPWSTGDGMSAEDVATLRRTVADLVALDIAHGSTGIDLMAARAFHDARRRLAVSSVSPLLTVLLVDAVAELGQLAAWLAHDASRDDAARALLVEALMLTGTATPGPHRAELIVLDQLAMLAERTGAWAEAVRLAERAMAQTEGSSPRIRAMPYVRRGRALASAGHGAGLEDLRRAASLLDDGGRDDDPPWAWWLHHPEVTIHQALAASALGDGHRAVDLAQQAIGELDPRQRRDAVVYRATLLRIAARAQAWGVVTAAATDLVTSLPEAGSARAVARVRGVAATLLPAAPPGAVEAVRAVLDAVGDIVSP